MAEETGITTRTEINESEQEDSMDKKWAAETGDLCTATAVQPGQSRKREDATSLGLAWKTSFVPSPVCGWEQPACVFREQAGLNDIPSSLFSSPSEQPSVVTA